MRVNFDYWKANVETLLARTFDSNENALMRTLYERRLSYWDAYDFYLDMALVRKI